MSIQWFPGHMNRARREVAKTMEAIDVVVELVDARIPKASSNPMIADLRQQFHRPCLKVLNKADLADPAITKAWVKTYQRQEGVNAVAISGNFEGQAAKVPGLCQRLAPSRNSAIKPLRMLILGIPNVGKSTFMNTLLKRRITQVGNEPAVTKKQQRHKLSDSIVLIDSPGLLWPKIQDPVVGFLLATIHAIGANAVVDEEIAEFLAATLLQRYPTLLMRRYGIERHDLNGEEILEAIAIKRGCLRKGTGGELDKEKAARILLKEYRHGILGRTSLESPEEVSAS